MKQRIAIQGIKGSFHHLVAQRYYGEDVEVAEMLTFDDVVAELLKSNCTEAVMAIENSIAGSIIPNYALIDFNELQILGEEFLKVDHYLMALSNQRIEDIKEVHSHPMALLQCKAFLKTYPHLKLVEAQDTAEVAKQIEHENLKGIAAISSANAAKLYKLNILASRIQTIKENETRFIILKKRNAITQFNKEACNKASIKFDLEHKRGSLATLLNVISDCKLSLTKIQSLPIIETPWRYSFFVDVTFDTYSHFEKAESIINIMATEFKVLGVYKNAKL